MYLSRITKSNLLCRFFDLLGSRKFGLQCLEFGGQPRDAIQPDDLQRPMRLLELRHAPLAVLVLGLVSAFLSLPISMHEEEVEEINYLESIAAPFRRSFAISR